MPDDSIELKERISRLSDEELLMMVNEKRADYQQEALDSAVAELVRRGVSLFGQNRQSQIEELDSEPQEIVVEETTYDEKYKGVGGWLLFLCIILTVITPLLAFFRVITGFSASVRYSERLPSLSNMLIVETIFNFALLCFSLFAGISLWRGEHNAPPIAKTYFVVTFVFTVVDFLLLYTIRLPAEIINMLVSQSVPSVIGATFSCTIWLAYLTFSKRVRATYGGSSADLNLGETGLSLNR